MKTNIPKLKELSKALLYIPIDQTEFSPAIVIHPYFESAITFVNGEAANILEDETALKTARRNFLQQIENAHSPEKLMFLVRNPYYLTWLRYAKQNLSPEDFSLLLGEAWCSQENPNGDINVPIRMSCKWFEKADKKILMTKEEYAYWSSLPPKMTVFRGVSPGREEKGLSWTRDYDKAVWFSNRFGNGYVLQMEVERKDVLAYFSRRSEDEIVAFPGNYVKVKK